jgi:asparagine synthase (glutamine-hydrolysing)
MCGICGIWGGPGREALGAMVAALGHRGPDDDGMHVDERIALGHTRLAILDPSEAGHQPMRNAEGSVWLSYNGEMYNFAEERAALEARGHGFTSGSDTEVVLRLYEVYGDDFLQRLRGIFALALYDRRAGRGRERLLLARDHLGVKPLLYAGDANRLVFASELKALLASSLVAPRIDAAALEDLLAFGSVAQPGTMIQGVRALPPAHRLIVEGGRMALECYWRLDANRVPALKGMAYGEQVAELRRLLETTVRLHMVSDVPVGAFLSGGIDSTVLCALMSRMSPHPLRTFSVGFRAEGAAIDESDEAARAAQFVGTQHRRVLVTGEDVREHIERFARSLDQPSVDGLNSYFVCNAAAGHVKVAISGTGGDELFAGYPWFAAMARAEGRRRSAAPGAVAARVLSRLAQPRVWDAVPGSLAARAIERARAQTDFLGAFARQYLIFGPHRARGLLAEAPFSPMPSGRQRAALADALPGASLVARVSALCLRGYAQNQLLRDIDAVSMAHSLEVRVPLLDPVLTDFALSLPDGSKLADATLRDGEYRQTGAKRALIDATRDLLPRDIDLRPKRGFAMPFDAWLRGPLREVLEDTLGERTVRSRGLLDAERVTAVRKDFEAGRAPWSLPWLLMIVELWCRGLPGRAA